MSKEKDIGNLERTIDKGIDNDNLSNAMKLANNTIYKHYLTELESYNIVEPTQTFLDETPEGCIRMYHLEELACKKGEDIFQKLSTVYHASMSLGCNLIVMVDVDAPNAPAKIYIGVRRSKSNDTSARELTTSYITLQNGILSNFPGSKLKKVNAKTDLPLLMDDVFGNHINHISAVSCVASARDKSKTENKNFIQGLERLVDTMQGNTYTALLIAEPISAEKQSIIRSGYEDIYSQISAFSKTVLSLNETSGHSVVETITEGMAHSVSKSISKTQGKTNTFNAGISGGAGVGPLAFLGISFGYSHSSSKSNTEGKTEGDTHHKDESIAKGNQTSSGKTIQIESVNKQATEMLSRIDEQLKRIKQCEDYGAYSCSAYFLSSRQDSCLLAANTYRALMLGDGSSVESGAINTWSIPSSTSAETKCVVPIMKEYLRRFTHPEFTVKINTTDIPYTPGTIVSGSELPLHLGLPTRSVYGLPVIEYAEFGRNINLRENVGEKQASSINLGTIYHMGKEENADVSLDVKSLAMHTFITGSTGSGKSNTVYQILQELNKQNIHFLVVEPAKGEYKNVFGNGNAKVYGTNPYLTPLLKINPFKFPKQIHVLEHIDRLIEIFNVCWPMYAAMPAVLKDSVERAYISSGWDLSTSKNKYNDELFPTFVDVLEELNSVVTESAFSQEVKDNYIGSLATRIKSLTNGIYGKIFDNNELGDAELFDENVVIDLSRVGSVETKAMIMGIIVMRLQEYRMTSGKMNADLQHVTVLEEAHNLLKRTSSEQSSESSNLIGKSVEMLSNIIAEVRTYGEGFIIADQAPGLLDLSVIRNTNTKIIMRLPDEEDRKLVGKSASLNDEQIKELARLPVGVAAIYQNNWIEPVLCKMSEVKNSGEAYSQPIDIEPIINNREPLKNIIQFLLMSRVPEKVDFDISELENNIMNLDISIGNKLKLLSIINEYKNNKSIKIASDDKFEELSKLITSLLKSEQKVDAIVNQSNDFDDLSSKLHDSIVNELPDIDYSYSLAISQCFLKVFSLNSSENLNIYAAWRESVIEKGGII